MKFATFIVSAAVNLTANVSTRLDLIKKSVHLPKVKFTKNLETQEVFMKMMITAISTTAITLLLTQNVFAAATRAITVKSCTARFVLDNIDSEISPAITEVLSQKGYVDQAGPGLVSAEGDANRGSATYDFGKDGYLTIEVRVDHFVGVPAAKYVDVSHIEYGPDVNSGKPAPVKIDHFYNKTGLALGSTDKKASRDILEIVRNMPSCTEVQ